MGRMPASFHILFFNSFAYWVINSSAFTSVMWIPARKLCTKLLLQILQGLTLLSKAMQELLGSMFIVVQVRKSLKPTHAKEPYCLCTL
jgi:hypothetical protein